MPYKFGGRRSTGCDECRSSKLKVRPRFVSNVPVAHLFSLQCDERRPSCTRCSRIGRLCRYMDALALAFHDQTKYASQRAEALWQKRSLKANKDIDRVVSFTQSPPNVRALITEPLYEVALQRFFFDYVFPHNPIKGRAGHLEHLPTMYQALLSAPCFASALKTTALANLARRCGSPHALEEACGEYKKALHATNSALKDPNMVVQDGVLLACYILAICEVSLLFDISFCSRLIMAIS